MSTNWIKDIRNMHDHYGVHEAIAKNAHDPQWLKELLKFRVKFLQEELDELSDAVLAEDITDALIDLCVVAIGTLDLFKANSEAAWDEVLRANMEKVVGVKANRPNPLGLPDLNKPEGWRGPEYPVMWNGMFEQLELPLFPEDCPSKPIQEFTKEELAKHTLVSTN